MADTMTMNATIEDTLFHDLIIYFELYHIYKLELSTYLLISHKSTTDNKPYEMHTQNMVRISTYSSCYWMSISLLSSFRTLIDTPGHWIQPKLISIMIFSLIFRTTFFFISTFIFCSFRFSQRTEHRALLNELIEFSILCMVLRVYQQL